MFPMKKKLVLFFSGLKQVFLPAKEKEHFLTDQTRHEVSRPRADLLSGPSRRGAREAWRRPKILWGHRVPESFRNTKLTQNEWNRPPAPACGASREKGGVRRPGNGQRPWRSRRSLRRPSACRVSFFLPPPSGGLPSWPPVGLRVSRGPRGPLSAPAAVVGLGAARAGRGDRPAACRGLSPSFVEKKYQNNKTKPAKLRFIGCCLRRM